jgi:hypothetical protein
VVYKEQVAGCATGWNVSMSKGQTLEPKAVVLTGRLVWGKLKGPRSPEPIWLTPLRNHASEIGVGDILQTDDISFQMGLT